MTCDLLRVSIISLQTSTVMLKSSLSEMYIGRKEMYLGREMDSYCQAHFDGSVKATYKEKCLSKVILLA